MIITNKIRIGRIISGTGRNMLYSASICIVAYFSNEFLIKDHFTFPVFVTSIIATAISFFIGFNNNQAYSRWWEARKVWGTLVNSSRTWTRMILSYIDSSESEHLTEIKQKMVLRHIAFLYALKANLRKSNDQSFKNFLTEEEFEKTKNHSNKYNAILTMQTDELESLYRSRVIDGFKLLEFNKVINSFCDEMGKSERIKGTVYPTIYTYYSRIFI